jgi:hypothetical protein
VCKSFSEKNISKVSLSYLALFTSPHRVKALVNKYKTVFIVAGGFSIAVKLFYLKQLIYKLKPSRSLQLTANEWLIDILLAIVVPLNNALKDNTLNNGYISNPTIKSYYLSFNLI